MSSKATHSPSYTTVQPQTVAQNPCGIDQPHKLHTATLEQATYHIAEVIAKHCWLRSKAASILEDMRQHLPYLPSLAAPREHSAKWYSVQLMRAYIHTHSTHSVRQRIEQLYEVML